MNSRIFMSSPDVGELEEQYVVSAIRSGWIAPLGPDVDAFEREMADRVGTDHAVALSSGTAALHLGLLGMGVGPGDLVVTSTMTFAATANAIVYTGAEPFFIDCELRTGNMDPVLLRTALENLTMAGKSVRAIVPVDLLGKAVDYTSICAIAEEFGIPVLSDAAESLGASHKNKAAGSFGRASAISFNGNKIMTTSGGGMLLTNDSELAAHTRYLATQARQAVSHYEHVDIGFNYRLSNVLAALGRAQLTRLDDMIERRHLMRQRYRGFFRQISGVKIFGGDDDGEDNYWLTSIVIDPEVAKWSPAMLSQSLAQTNIESRPLWKPMHAQPVFASAQSLLNGNSQSLFETGLTLPSGSALTDEEVARVFSALETFLARE
jgi:dTDP-4-amino-4,6-dideoxygalactose transaminase